MSDWLKDRMRLPRRSQVKIDTEKARFGSLRVRECQVHDALRFTFPIGHEANLTRAEALELAEWLMEWSKNAD